MCKLCEAEQVLSGQLHRVTLTNTKPGHNKRYTLWLEEIRPGTYIVKASWGPIGKWSKEMVKGGPYSLAIADLTLLDLVAKEESKGYVQRECDRVICPTGAERTA